MKREFYILEYSFVMLVLVRLSLQLFSINVDKFYLKLSRSYSAGNWIRTKIFSSLIPCDYSGHVVVFADSAFADSTFANCISERRISECRISECETRHFLYFCSMDCIQARLEIDLGSQSDTSSQLFFSLYVHVLFVFMFMFMFMFMFV
jgi:hypothetical protein